MTAPTTNLLASPDMPGYWACANEKLRTSDAGILQSAKAADRCDNIRKPRRLRRVITAHRAAASPTRQTTRPGFSDPQSALRHLAPRCEAGPRRSDRDLILNLRAAHDSWWRVLFIGARSIARQRV